MRRKVNRIDPLKFWEVWTKLLEETREGAAIVVEGKHDYIVLRELFVEGKIYTCSERSASLIADLITSEGVKKVIILTDFDKMGEKKAWELAFFFKNAGIKVLEGLREEIKKVLGRISCIEDLRFYTEQLLEKAPLNLYLKSERGLVLMGYQ
ncbi:MAG: toprim domain-containing protein [Candidatus Njordarchaeales archaeon]